MEPVKGKFVAVAIAAYGLMLGLASMPAIASDSAIGSTEPGATPTELPAPNSPAPGSEGDTLTIEDARMALLVYKLLDADGKLKGANIERGAKLFHQNCRACHGEDGHRLNFEPFGKPPAYIGDRARDDLPTFWYQMNFGDDVRNMQPYYDEFTVEEMVDIAGYAQTLP